MNMNMYFDNNKRLENLSISIIQPEQQSQLLNSNILLSKSNKFGGDICYKYQRVMNGEENVYKKLNQSRLSQQTNKPEFIFRDTAYKTFKLPNLNDGIGIQTLYKTFYPDREEYIKIQEQEKVNSKNSNRQQIQNNLKGEPIIQQSFDVYSPKNELQRQPLPQIQSFQVQDVSQQMSQEIEPEPINKSLSYIYQFNRIFSEKLLLNDDEKTLIKNLRYKKSRKINPLGSQNYKQFCEKFLHAKQVSNQIICTRRSIPCVKQMINIQRNIVDLAQKEKLMRQLFMDYKQK